MARSVEMFVAPLDGSPGDTFTQEVAAHERTHDVVRRVASFALATYDWDRRVWVRPSRRSIRTNSVQGVAWLDSNPAHVAYYTVKG